MTDQDNPKHKEQTMVFEEAMEKMEKIVQQLEEGDVPLEKAIELFQQGMSLSKLCHERLQKVETKMDQILQEDGQVQSFIIQEDDQS